MSKALRAEALDRLPDLCARAGMPGSGWRVRDLVLRDDPIAQVAVLRVTRGSDDLVLKLERRPGHDVTARLAEHEAVQAIFPRSDRLTVPQLLAHDGAGGSLAEFFDGVPLAVRLDAPFAQQLPDLRRAGAWLAAFHRARLGACREFRPWFGIKTLNGVLDDLRRGKAHVAEQERFIAAAAALKARREDWKGQITQPAAQHDDLHMRNILMNDQAVAGIDFAGGHMAPVGHDIARLLVDYAAIRAPLDRLRPSEVLPAEALAAFFDGYDLVGLEDPSVQMMLRLRVLTDWRGLPADSRKMSPAKARRLVGLMRIAENVFEL